MQTTTAQFDRLAVSHLRPLNYAVNAALDKRFNPDIKFFTLNQSVLNGPDILASTDSNVVMEWDKYTYSPLTNRVMSIEITQEEEEPYSVARAFADVKMNNYDGYFTPGSDSPVAEYMIPRRPFRLYTGFGNNLLPQMVGLSETTPELDKASRTATFHITDFLSYLYDKDISESVILKNKRTDEILAYLLQLMGLSSTQYVLDTGMNTVAFFYVEKGQKFGEIANKLMEAESGRLYLDELGTVRFKNIFNYYSSPVTGIELNQTNVIDYSTGTDDKIINSVKVKCDILELAEKQSVWTNPSPTEVGAYKSVDVWVEFADPIDGADEPTYSADEVLASYYTSTTTADGDTPNMAILLDDFDLFSKSAKLTFKNYGGTTGYIKRIDIWGTPAKAINNKIKVEVSDQDSMDDYEEQLVEIDNPYIQTQSAATTRAVTLVNEYKDPRNVLEVEYWGNMALSLGDKLTVNLDGITGTFIIRKLENILSDSPRFIQRLRLVKFKGYRFFTLNSSILNGPDVLAPGA